MKTHPKGARAAHLGLRTLRPRVCKIVPSLQRRPWGHGMEKQFRQVNGSVRAEIRALRQEVEWEFGTPARVSVRVTGPLLLWPSRREEGDWLPGRLTSHPPFSSEVTGWKPKLTQIGKMC
jgi:hypothetical protein